MNIEGPEKYTLKYSKDSFEVHCSKGTNKFSGNATSKLPKLYVVTIEGNPVYVGMTKQPLRNRLRQGWKAKGKNGYHGYAWRDHGDTAEIYVWTHTNSHQRDTQEIETVEAEVVFLIRARGQWPEFQTEIHFHKSTDEHRQVADDILNNLS